MGDSTELPQLRHTVTSALESVFLTFKMLPQFKARHIGIWRPDEDTMTPLANDEETKPDALEQTNEADKESTDCENKTEEDKEEDEEQDITSRIESMSEKLNRKRSRSNRSSSKAKSSSTARASSGAKKVKVSQTAR